MDIDDIPLDDPAVTCGMLSRGDTQGVFQLESDGMTKLLVDLAPTSFRDLIPLVALYRPGPLGLAWRKILLAGNVTVKRRPRPCIRFWIDTGGYIRRSFVSGTGYADYVYSGRVQPGRSR
jgi:hypothetical protein